MKNTLPWLGSNQLRSTAARLSVLPAAPPCWTTRHTIYNLSIIQAAGSHTSLRHTQSPSALLDLQSGFRISNRFVCCCVKATIQPSIPTTSLGLTLLPICSVCCSQQPLCTNPWCLQIRKLPRASSCTHGLVTVSFHSFSLSVSFDAVSIRYTYRLAPWLLYLLSDLN